MKDLVSRIQRELPDTDKNRYDVAYERGRAQARSSLLFGGLAFGALAGAGLMFLFDPSRGAGRRAQLASRATGIRNDLARTAEARRNNGHDGRRRAGANGTPVGVMAPADAQAEAGNPWEAAEREAREASEAQTKA